MCLLQVAAFSSLGTAVSKRMQGIRDRFIDVVISLHWFIDVVIVMFLS